MRNACRFFLANCQVNLPPHLAEIGESFAVLENGSIIARLGEARKQNHSRHLNSTHRRRSVSTPRVAPAGRRREFDRPPSSPKPNRPARCKGPPAPPLRVDARDWGAANSLML